MNEQNEELQKSCQEGDFHKAQTLLQNGADPSWQNIYGWTALHRACQMGREDIVSLLMADKRVDPGAQDTFGFTPLHRVCQQGNANIVRILLNDERVNPNKTNDDRWTPLHCACQTDAHEAVEVLIQDPRIDARLETRTGLNTLELAFQREYSQSTVVLIRAGVTPIIRNQLKHDLSPFKLACASGDVTTVGMLLNNPSIDPTEPYDKYNNNVLHIAVGKQHTTLVELLLNDGRIDPNETNVDEETPLVLATLNGYAEIVAVLLADERIEPSLEIASALVRKCIDSSFITAVEIGFLFYKFTGYLPEEMLGTDYPNERRGIEYKIKAARKKSGRK